MIKFTCNNCDHGIKVNEKYAGKKGKCPKCGKLVMVPSITSNSKATSIIKFRCPNCQQKIGLKTEYAGKQVRCAHCRQRLTVPAASETKSASPAHETDVLSAGLATGTIPDQQSSDGSDLLSDLLAQEENAPAVSLPQKKESNESYALSPPSDTHEQHMSRMGEPETDQAGKRRLPWPIDILLYPFSRGGS